jgi:outer membrane receptor protein involved in Fe transport
LPTGTQASLSIGAQIRQQRLETWTVEQPGPGVSSDLGRDVTSAFAQATVPIFGGIDTPRGFERLELSAGVRFEHFSDVGNATAPRVGILWSPIKGFLFHANWGRSFRAPNLPDRIETANESALFQLPDRSSPSGQSVVLAWTGGNADLRPESARSFSASLDLAPDELPQFTLSLTYFATDVEGRTQESFLTSNILQDPTMTWSVTRDVTDALREQVCQRSTFRGSAAECLSTPISAVVDLRLHNTQSLIARGLDIAEKYRQPIGRGSLDLGLNATYLLNFLQRQSPTSSALELRNTQNNPTALRFRGSAEWRYRGMGTALFWNYTGAYHDTSSVPARRVSPWATLDAQIACDSVGSDVPGNIHFALNVENLLNTPPPFLNNSAIAIGYDPENAYLRGRLIGFEVSKRW